MSDQALRQASAAIARFAMRRAALVVTAYLAASSAAIVAAVSTIAIDSDHGKLIAQDLPFRRAFVDFVAAMPDLDNALVASIESDEPRLADAAARAFADALRARPELFSGVRAHGLDEARETDALLYADDNQFNRASDGLKRLAPLLHAPAREPGIAGGATMLKAIAFADPDATLAPILVDGLALAVASGLDGRWSPTPWNEILAPADLAPDATRRIVSARPRSDFHALVPAEEAINEARRIAKDRELTFGGRTRIRLTGEAVLAAEELDTIARGATASAVLSIALVALILLFGIGSPRVAIAALATLLAGLSLTSAAAAAFGALNPISAAFAVLFVGLGIDFAIHYALRCEEECENQTNNPNLNPKDLEALEHAIERAASRVAPALAICTATTGCAFLAFTVTDFRGMAQLGGIAALGMIIALVASTTLLPALLRLIPRRSGANLGASTSKPLSSRNVTALGAASAILVVAGGVALILGDARFDGNPLNLRDPRSTGAKTFADLINDPDIPAYTLELLADDPDDADRVAERMEKLAQIRRAATLESFVPDDQPRRLKALRDIRQALPAPPYPDVSARRRDLDDQALPALRDAAEALARTDAPVAPKAKRLADVLKRFEERLKSLDDDNARRRELDAFAEALFGGLPGAAAKIFRLADAEALSTESLPATLRRSFVAPDGRRRVSLIPEDSLRDEDAMRDVVRAAREIDPRVTGAPSEITGAADVVVDSMARAVPIAAGACLLILLLLLRNPLDAALALCPALFAAWMTLASMAALNLPFTFANVIVLPLIIGLGVDGGVHLLMRAREGRPREWNGKSTPRAVTLSALTTAASFGSLALSPHPGTAGMGTLLTLAAAWMIVAVLVAMPPLLRRRTARLDATSPSEVNPNQP